MSSERLLAFVLLITTLVPLFGAAFHEPDEGRYAEIAREMVATGDFLVPRFQGREHLTKPPLTYWTLAVFLKVLGTSVFAARLPVVLAGLATVLVVRRLGFLLFDPEVGNRAAIVFATSLYGSTATHFISTDVFVLFLQALGVLAAVSFAEAETPAGRRRWRFAFWVVFGLAFFTKGPPALLALPAALFWLHRRRLGESIVSIAGITLFLALSAWWFVAIVWRDPARLDFFLVEEVWQRVATDHHRREKSVLIYLGILLLGPLPHLGGHRLWFGGWRDVIERGRPRESFVLLLAWFLPSLLIFSLARSRMILYLGPIFVPMTLAMAALTTGPSLRGKRLALVCLLAATVFSIAQVVVRERGLGGDEARVAALIAERGEGWIDATEGRQAGLDFLLDGLKPRSRRPRPKGDDAGEALASDLTTPSALILVRREDLAFCTGQESIYVGDKLALVKSAGAAGPAARH